jgi:3-methyl-2-oxobutanoate hydroxymethyltransferase
MEKITIRQLQTSKSKHQKISMLTAYDYSFAKILDEAGVDIILVGDSLGNVVLGQADTHSVTMEDMLHHTRAAAQGVKRALLIADMPFGSMKNAIANARKLMQAGAEGVKIEGVKDIEGIKAIIKQGIPVMGHLGVLPQTAKEYKIQRSPEIVEQAKLLEQAGVFAIVLELVDPALAKEITKTVKVPTIGIGSGPDCDGQVLVTYDMLGLYPNVPKHAKKYVDLTAEIKKAIQQFVYEVARF